MRRAIVSMHPELPPMPWHIMALHRRCTPHTPSKTYSKLQNAVQLFLKYVTWYQRMGIVDHQ